MTYNKTTWKTGDTITADKLNNIETGISNSLDVNSSNISNTGKSNLSVLSMPSNRYIDLTLGESGSTYTAPANGWLVLAKFATQANEYVQLNATPSTLGDSNNFITTAAAPTANYVCDVFMPMIKGQSTTVNYYTTGDVLAFRFIYAEGEQ